MQGLIRLQRKAPGFMGASPRAPYPAQDCRRRYTAQQTETANGRCQGCGQAKLVGRGRQPASQGAGSANSGPAQLGGKRLAAQFRERGDHVEFVQFGAQPGYRAEQLAVAQRCLVLEKRTEYLQV